MSILADEETSNDLQKAKKLFLDGRRGDAARMMMELGLTSQKITELFDKWYKEEGGPKELGGEPLEELKALPAPEEREEKTRDLQEAKKLFLDEKRGDAARMMMKLGLTSQEVQSFFDQWYKEMGGQRAMREKPPKDERKLLPPPEEGKNLPVVAGPRELGPVKEKPKVTLGTRVKRITLRRGGLSRKSEIVWTLVMIIIGMTGSALLGSMWIFFAFLSLALYIILPAPDEIVGRELRKIKEKYVKQIEGASEEETEKIKAAMDAELENQRTIEVIKSKQGMIKWGASSMKYLFKAMFFVFFSLGFITSAIPLLKPIGIFLAFLGYFMEG